MKTRPRQSIPIKIFAKYTNTSQTSAQEGGGHNEQQHEEDADEKLVSAARKRSVAFFLHANVHACIIVSFSLLPPSHHNTLLGSVPVVRVIWARSASQSNYRWRTSFLFSVSETKA